MSIDVIWNNIIKHQGEQFYTTAQHNPFSYNVKGNCVILNNTNQNIPRSNFEIAIKLSNPTVSKLNALNLRGPSYIMAIISDSRIIR